MSPKPTKSLFAKPFEKVWSSWNLFDWGLRRANFPHKIHVFPLQSAPKRAIISVYESTKTLTEKVSMARKPQRVGDGASPV